MTTGVITGYHAIEESLRASGKAGILYVAGKGARIERLIDIAKSAGTPVRRISPQSLDGLTKGREHRGAAYARGYHMF